MKVRQLLPLFAACLFLLPFAVGGRHEKTLVEPPWNHRLGLDRVGQFLLGVYSGFGERFVDPAGLDCVKLLSEDDPAAGDDDELTVFGCDRGSGRLFYNRGMRSIGIVGAAEGRAFSRPGDVVATRDGNVFVADTGNDRVALFRLDREHLAEAGVVDSAGGKWLTRPEGLAYGGGALWIADTGNDRIVLIGAGGGETSVIGPDLVGGRLYGPTRIDVAGAGDAWLYYADRFAAVVDSLGKRLVLIEEGGGVRAVGRRGDLPGEGRFEDAAIDYYGNVWVTDPPAGVVHKFDRRLRHIVSVGEAGDAFDEPRGIAINRRFGQVFVSERGGARYRWIGADLLDVTARAPIVDRESGRIAVEVSFLLTEHAAVSCRIEDEDRRTIAVLLDDHLFPAGRISRRVEAGCDTTALRANCTMRVVVTAKPTYSSASFLLVERIASLSESSPGHDRTASTTSHCLSETDR